MPQNEEVQAFMEKLGSFYEIVDEDSPVPRVPKDSPSLQTENHIPAEDETDENTGKHILKRYRNIKHFLVFLLLKKTLKYG